MNVISASAKLRIALFLSGCALKVSYACQIPCCVKCSVEIIPTTVARRAGFSITSAARFGESPPVTDLPEHSPCRKNDIMSTQQLFFPSSVSKSTSSCSTRLQSDFDQLALVGKRRACLVRRGGRMEEPGAENNGRVRAARYDCGAEELHEVIAQRVSALRRSAYRLLKNTADAEDAVQDALLSACKHLHQFRGESQISTWLSAIVFNSARMQLRRHSRRPSISLDARLGSQQEYPLSEQLMALGPNPEEQCRESELATHLQRGLNRLPSVLRTTYQMREVGGFSIEEIAQTLKLPTGTVKARLSRARARLRKSMVRVLTR